MEQNNQGAQAPVAQVAPAAPVAEVAKAPQAPQPEPQPAAVAEVVQPAPAPSPSPSPEPDRTGQQFDKLVDSNKRLYEANQLLQQALTDRANSNATFAPVAQPQAAQQPQQRQAQQQQQQPVMPQVPQGQQAPQVTDFIETNPATGEQYINRTKFEAAYTEVNQRAKRAEEVVTNYIQQAEAREVDRQNRDAWQAYPELNPGSQTFDARFSQQARAIIYDSMINPQDYGGRPLGFKDAADYLKGGAPAPKQAAPAATPVMDEATAAKNQTAKEQASLAATPQPQQASTHQSQDEAYSQLVMGTRTGSDEALARRLLNSPHKLEDIEAAVAAK